MQILIINLPKSQERRVFQEQQFLKFGLQPTFLQAVSTDQISEEQFNAEAFGWQRPLKKVELACFLSHKKAWQRVSACNEPVLILEDDAVVVSDIAQLLQDIQSQILNLRPDLINLEVRSRKKIVGKKPICHLNNSGYKLLDLFQERTGTGGYILFPTGAQKLLEKANHYAAATADAFIFSTYSLNAYQVEPAALIQEDQMIAYGLSETENFESTIGRSENFKPIYKSLSEKKMFRKRRVMGQLQMARRYLSVIFKADKREIRLDRRKFDGTAQR
ncbi:glycosyltransferase family 25 protein [Acinetobacter pseudolwoffii]|uniref:glycosyltransferase family 25 protein n=1 Tax=Acinetobacter pseudolwoffii TaxID=2053287 RepID=UPI001CE1167F|nr:glycosyltransferase family 25 protein [Acinetobacter pseudolwoffii]UBX51994.1 glycosyltransferase family 25 protein [Acinetobacter pseudolwoffii]